MGREELLKSISECVYDYRINEISQITPSHIDKWVKQFETEDQIVILNELNHILKNYYISRNQAKNNLKSFLLDERISGLNPCEYLEKLNFICIQTKGYSQKDMLELVSEILEEEFSLDIEECGGSNDYLYIDDCIFTGNRFRYDIVPWIEKKEFNEGSKLITYHIGHHIAGYEYAIKYINRVARDKDINVSCWYHILIDNVKRYGSSPQVLWPGNFTGDISVDNYYNVVKERCYVNGWQDNCFRTHTIENEGLFTSYESRDIVEKAFVKVGTRLVDGAANPSESMRPLGFEKLESLGFGSVFITYRNISNNCPLALWYGDSNHATGPLGNWYPLFIRKVNDVSFGWEVFFG